MVKHTQTIRRQEPTNCLSVFDFFVGLALKGFNNFKESLRFLKAFADLSTSTLRNILLIKTKIYD